MRAASLRYAVAAVLAAACAQAHAAADVFELELRTSAGYTDNVNRTGVGEESSAAFALGGRILYEETTRRLDAQVNGDLDYVAFTQESADDQVVGNLYGNATFGIVPERFNWVLTNSYGQGRFDLTAPSSSINSEGINFLSTGPDLIFRLSSRDFARLYGRYANSWYEESLGDNSQYGGGLTLGRNLDADSTVSLTGNYTRIDYDVATAPTVDHTQGYLTYESAGARSSISMDLGYRKIDDGTDSDDGPLVRASISRELSGYVSLNAFGGYEYNDQAGTLQRDLSQPSAPGSTNGYGTGGLFEDLYGGIGVRFDRARTRLNAAVSYHDQNYARDDLSDNTRTQFDVGAERDLGPSWSAGTRLWFWQEDFTNQDAENEETTFSLFARWRSARTFGAEASWDYWDRSSDFGDAHESRVWLRLTWQPVKRGQ